MDHALSTRELRDTKPDRANFPAMPRAPITVVLDGVTGNYNLGAIFRLCDAFLAERLIVCGAASLSLRKRKLVQAAKGAERWVPWEVAADAAAAVYALKEAGYWIVAVELTAASVPVTAMRSRFPAAVVLGNEMRGVSPEVLACADQVVAIPMRGMANSLNVATAAAIVLHELAGRLTA
jgi:tRNA G18 (ribose-2'-O)-methylase SpoU